MNDAWNVCCCTAQLTPLARGYGEREHILYAGENTFYIECAIFDTWMNDVWSFVLLYSTTNPSRERIWTERTPSIYRGEHIL